MSYSNEDLLPLSALQHLIFCRRQCALIHIEQVWVENLLTAEGRIMHNRIHSEKHESRGSIHIEYAVPIRSLRLGLIGKADVVEFHLKNGRWMPFPVEYKRGKPKDKDCDRVQLCAQAFCLEEVLNVEIIRGALFYGKTRRREEVVFDEILKQKTKDTARRLHELIASEQTPKPVYSSTCKRCSLVDVCLPRVMGKRNSVKNYLLEALKES